MKKITHILYGLAGAAALLPLGGALAGCNDDLYGVDRYIITDKPMNSYIEGNRDFYFPAEGGTDAAYVVAGPGQTYTFDGLPAWLTAGTRNGDAVPITAAANTSANPREALFQCVFSNGQFSYPWAMHATQEGVAPYFEFTTVDGEPYTSSAILTNSSAHTVNIGFSTNYEGLIAKVTQYSSSYGTDWCTANIVGSNLQVALQENTTSATRKVYVEIYYTTEYGENYIVALTISQAMPGFDYTGSTYISADAAGGQKTLSFSSDASWRVACDESWLTLSAAEGTAGDNQQVVVSYTPNASSQSRTARLTFYIGSVVRKQVDIVQDGAQISLSRTSVNVNADGSSSEAVKVSSNCTWKVLSQPDWLTVTPARGEWGETTVTFSATTNNSLNERTGTVKIAEANAGTVTKSLTVTQKGIGFDENTTWEYAWAEYTRNWPLPFPSSWQATLSAGWVTLSSYSGSADNVDVTVSTNTGEDARTAKINFLSEGKSYPVNVIQEGQYLRFSKTSGEFAATGGSLEIYNSSTVFTVASIEYTDGDGWLTKTYSDNGKTITLTAAANPSSNIRKADLVYSVYDNRDEVAAKWAKGVKISLVQAGRNVSCDVSEIYFFAQGGTSARYHITSDGAFNIANGAGSEFFTIVSEGDAFYIVCKDNTTGAERRGSVVISLEGLPAGESKQIEIPVIQYGSDTNITIDPWDDPIIL